MITLKELDPKVISTINETIDRANETGIQLVKIQKMLTDGNGLLLSKDKKIQYVDIDLDRMEKTIEASTKKINELIEQTNTTNAIFKALLSSEGYIYSDGTGSKLYSKNINFEALSHKKEEKIDLPLRYSDLDRYIERGISMKNYPMLGKVSSSTKNAAFVPNIHNYLNVENQIEYVKFIKSFIIIIDSTGRMVIRHITKQNIIYDGKIFDLIKINLNLSLTIADISLIEPSGNGLFICTKSNGVLFIDVTSNAIASLYSDNEVVYIRKRTNDVIVISDTISIYNKENMKKFSNPIFKNLGLRAISVTDFDDKIMVLCRSKNMLELEDLLFCFKEETDSLVKINISTDYSLESNIKFKEIKNNIYTVSIIGYSADEIIEVKYYKTKLEAKPDVLFDNKGISRYIEDKYMYELKENNIKLYSSSSMMNMIYKAPEKKYRYIKIYEDKLYLVYVNGIHYIDLKEINIVSSPNSVFEIYEEINKSNSVFVFVNTDSKLAFKSNLGQPKKEFIYNLDHGATYFAYMFDNIEAHKIQITIEHPRNEEIHDLVVFIDTKYE